MRCPSCLTPLAESVNACPNCRFSIDGLDIRFGTVPKMQRYVTDLSGIFTPNENNALVRRLEKTERSFPGLVVSVVAMDVHRRFNPREYLFWLTNRCNFCPIDSREERSFFVVLFFDTASRTTILTTGYGMQTVYPEEKLEATLTKGTPEFKKNQFYKGCTTVFKEMHRTLLHQITEARKARKNPALESIPAEMHEVEKPA